MPKLLSPQFGIIIFLKPFNPYSKSHFLMSVWLTFGNMTQATLIDPSINGTMNVLNSCLKANSVKRVVLTSSCSAIRYRYDVQQLCPLNESHWTDPDYCKSYNVRTNLSFSVLFHVSFQCRGRSIQFNRPKSRGLLLFLFFLYFLHLGILAALVCICKDFGRERGLAHGKRTWDGSSCGEPIFCCWPLAYTKANQHTASPTQHY